MSHPPGDTPTAPDTFLRQYARTSRLTLGEPRTITVSPDGRRVVFVRSAAPDDPANALWALDALTGEERCVADPRRLLAGSGDEGLPAAERARRERVRESAGGIVSYATDRDMTVFATALAGRLFVGGLLSGQARELHVPGPVFDPRPDPAARRVAYVSGTELRVTELDGSSRQLAADDDPAVSWGAAEFVAAEEMGRQRGFWWSPGGDALAACRVDVTPVGEWFIADPAHPERPPVAHRYPAAGTANARVELHVVRLDGRAPVRIDWDASAYPYLAHVAWSTSGLILAVHSRDQKTLVVLRADPHTGATRELHVERDETWVELVAGTPALLADGRLVHAGERDGTRRLLVDGTPVSPAGLQLRHVIAADDTRVVFAANPAGAPMTQGIWAWDGHGCRPLADGEAVHSAAAGGPTVVVRTGSLTATRSTTRILGGAELATNAAEPLVTPAPLLGYLGERALATAVLFPTGHRPGSPLPVLMDPYGGPHAQRVVASAAAFVVPQWFADQGFAVVVADGRGTPGRGSEWERAVHLDLASAVLEDQIDALHAAAAEHPDLDLSRVAIRGWSFGGYLAALAVLRRPDVFHAAVAGAPVTEWRLYDTHYTERYLGNPGDDAGPYERCSLLADAHRLSRPLQLIHGLADDNVVAAHTLLLSSALLAAGRAHEVLPLSGVTHMTPQEVVAENLLLLQVEFIHRALARQPAER